MVAVVVAACTGTSSPALEPSASGEASASAEPTPADLSARPLTWIAPLPPLPTGPGREYIGSEDFLNLFEAGAPWEQAAERIDVFKLYGEWVDFTTAGQLETAVAGIGERGMGPRGGGWTARPASRVRARG